MDVTKLMDLVEKKRITFNVLSKDAVYFALRGFNPESGELEISEQGNIKLTALDAQIGNLENALVALRAARKHLADLTKGAEDIKVVENREA
ncbi:MAG: hypothetical protein MUO24_02245 [Desulfobacterales bacterium]|nr:hypothetical protein [Desulfobacterales bacterium]